MSLVASMWCIWTLILLYFKCNSKHVGCAAGNAFAPRRLLSVRSSSDDEADSTKSSSESLEQKKLAEYVEEQADGKSSKESMKEGYGSSKYLQEQREVVPSRKGNHDDDNSTIIKTTNRSPRATRTRLCFLIFSLVTLGCVPCVIIFTFKPLLAARDDAISYIADSRDIIEKVKVIIDANTPQYYHVFDMDRNGTLTGQGGTSSGEFESRKKVHLSFTNNGLGGGGSQDIIGTKK